MRPASPSANYDVAIVGAGPAGAWTAYLLARAGVRVALFDASHPREKPCGGGVTGRALAMVARAVDGRHPTVAIRSAVFERETGGPVRVPLGAAGPGHGEALVVASRTAFDGALLDVAVAAGARHIPERVMDVAISQRGATLHTSDGLFTSGWLVGADGATSLVRRRLHRPFTRRQLSLAAGYFAAGVSAESIVLRLFSDFDGYLWSFPRPDHLAIGACAPADQVHVDLLRARVAGWIREGRTIRAAPLRAYSWAIPSLSAADLEQERPAGDRWLLVGDAAGLVDPITREGIYFGLESAVAAARAILNDEAHAGDHYLETLRTDVVAELMVAARLKRTFFHPEFTRLLASALESSERIRCVMADLVAGRQSYRTLKWRLLSTLELGLAWRALAPCLHRAARALGRHGRTDDVF